MKEILKAFKNSKFGDKLIVLSPIIVLIGVIVFLITKLDRTNDALDKKERFFNKIAYKYNGCKDEEEDDPSLEDIDYEEETEDEEDDSEHESENLNW